MADSFTIQQAYLVYNTLAFLPAVATQPDKLKAGWRGLSPFAEDWSPDWPAGKLEIPHVGNLLRSYNPNWLTKKLKYPAAVIPKEIDTGGWRFNWLPQYLPDGANPSTSLYIRLYPIGIVSIALATAVGFNPGIDVSRFIHLLRTTTPQKSGTSPKPFWLEIAQPNFFAGVQINLDSLTEMILVELQKALFETPASGQVVRMEQGAEAGHLEYPNGTVTDLAGVQPQQFERDRHAAAFRGIVTLRPNWQQLGDLQRLKKYKNAQAWTAWGSNAWHYAGGINTVLWHNTQPVGRGRRKRRKFTWLVAQVAELARMEEVLYRYSRDFVIRPAHDYLLQLKQDRGKTLKPANWPKQLELNEWSRFWLTLADLPRALVTPDAKQIYASHANQLGTNEARESFGQALEAYTQALSTYTTLGGDILKAVESLTTVLRLVTGVSGLVAAFGGKA